MNNEYHNLSTVTRCETFVCMMSIWLPVELWKRSSLLFGIPSALDRESHESLALTCTGVMHTILHTHFLQILVIIGITHQHTSVVIFPSWFLDTPSCAPTSPPEAFPICHPMTLRHHFTRLLLKVPTKIIDILSVHFPW